MALPKRIDEMVRKQFEKLIGDSTRLKQAVDTVRNDTENRYTPALIFAKLPIPDSSFGILKTSLISLLEFLGANGRHIASRLEDIRGLENTVDGANNLIGMVESLKSDYEAGFLDSLVEFVEDEVAADYLGQAEQLLQEGQPGKYDHVPAAVLLGAILEDALRRLCLRQLPPIDVKKPNGDPKTMGTLIDDLKKANVFNELKAKQLRAWADIRNAAAHGEFDKFARQDVEQMKSGVESFLADYL
jgi:hypothetical protein